MSVLDEMTPDKITSPPFVAGWFKYETSEAFYFLCRILAAKGNKFRPITKEEVLLSIREVFYPNLPEDTPFCISREYQAIDYYWEEISFFAAHPIRAADLDRSIAKALLP